MDLKIIKNKRAWRRYCREIGTDPNYAPEPKRYPCLLDVRYPGATFSYYYLRDIEKLRNQLINAGGSVKFNSYHYFDRSSIEKFAAFSVDNTCEIRVPCLL